MPDSTTFTDKYGRWVEMPDSSTDADVDAAIEAKYGTITKGQQYSYEHGMPQFSRPLNVKAMAAPALSAAAGIATGGLSVPIQALGQAGAGLINAAIRSPKEASNTDVLKNAAWDVGTNVAPTLVSAGGPAVKRLAERYWTGMAKPTVTALRDTTTMKAGGTEAEAAREVAQTVLGSGRGTLTQGNVKAAQDSLDALDQQLSGAIAGSRATIARSAVEKALIDEANRIGVGTIGKAQQQEALSRAFDELQKLPDQIPIQKAQEIKQSIYATRNYLANATDSAAAAADKVMGRSYRAEIEQAAPETKAINDQFRKEIPATKVLARAVQRTGNRNPVGLQEMVALASGNPLPLATAAANHPLIGSWITQQMYRAAPALPAAGNALRLAIMSQ